HEMEVAKTQTNISGKTQQELNTQVRRAEGEKADLQQKLIEHDKVAEVKLNSQKLMTQEANDRAKDADLSAQKAIAEKDRLKEEVKALTAIVASRDNTILALQNDNKVIRTEAIAQEGKAKTTQQRNVDLLAQIQELQRKVALREAGVGSDNLPSKDPNTPNPPSNYVKGKVDKVDAKDPSVVQISLG